MRERRIIILSLALASALVLTLFSNVRVYGQNTTTIRVVPPPIDVEEGQDFTVSVEIQDAVDVVAFQFKISWDTQFVQYVSHMVYPPWPIPITIPEPMIGDDYILIAAMKMPPSFPFSESAILATITFHAVNSGTTYVQISEVAISPNPEILITEDASVSILPSVNTWVSIFGTVSSYGVNAAHGPMGIFAVVDRWAGGWCIFTVPPLGPVILIYPPPPFNFSLYIARILNASTVKLNYNGYDLWISGFWEVANVTNPHDVRDIVNLLQSRIVAQGELCVTDNWTYFTINIQGYEPIKGNVTRHHIRTVDDSEDCQRYDLNHDYVVNMRDIGICCDAFGSTFGFYGYEFNADTNFDLRVDMRDIGDCCNNFGKTY